MNSLSAKNLAFIGLGFVVAGLIMVLGFKSSENVVVVGTFALVLGGIMFLLGGANVLFEQPNAKPQDFSFIPESGVKIQRNYMLGAFSLLPVGLFLFFFFSSTIRDEADLVLAGIFVLISIFNFAIRYVLFPDRLVIYSWTNLFFGQTIKFNEILSVALSVGQPSNQYYRARSAGDAAALAGASALASLAKPGNYGNLKIELTQGGFKYLSLVRLPENLISTINRLQS